MDTDATIQRKRTFKASQAGFENGRAVPIVEPPSVDELESMHVGEAYRAGRSDGLRAAFNLMAEARTMRSHRVRIAAFFFVLSEGSRSTAELARECGVTPRRMQAAISKARMFARML